ncbi:MAG: hypothetical protein ACLFP4_16700 [Spirochaetales bacterium]
MDDGAEGAGRILDAISHVGIILPNIAFLSEARRVVVRENRSGSPETSKPSGSPITS